MFDHLHVQHHVELFARGGQRLGSGAAKEIGAQRGADHGAKQAKHTILVDRGHHDIVPAVTVDIGHPKLEEAILNYSKRGLSTVEVIEELIKLAKELNAAKPPDGMTDEEWAFYQALATNESAVREMGHPALRALAQELTDKIRKSATIDWQNRKTARAKMMAMVKVLLKRHRYPPDLEPNAIDKVILQAETMADGWVSE